MQALAIFVLLWSHVAMGVGSDAYFELRGTSHEANSSISQPLLNAARSMIKIWPARNSHVITKNGNGEGSGFFISPELAITNSHVTWSAAHSSSQLYKFVYVADSGSAHLAVVVAEDFQNDLAILKTIKWKNPHFLNLNEAQTINKNDSLVALWASLLEVYEYKSHALKTHQHPPFNIIQIQGSPTPGQSGSAILSKDFKLAGVLFAGTESLSLAVPAEKLKTFIQKTFFILNEMGYKNKSLKTSQAMTKDPYIKSYFKTKQDIQQFNAYIKKHIAGIESSRNRSWENSNLHHPADSGCHPGGLNLYQKWLHKLAQNGHPFMQLLLGVDYEEGNDLQPNQEKANYWFQQAAKKGVSQAQYRLGRAYREKQKLKKALRRLKRAERHEPSKFHQLELGHTYEQLKKNKQALHWYQKAMASGSKHAVYHVNKLSAKQ